MSQDEQEIRQLVTTWLEATKAGDIETVLGLMVDDMVFLLPGQPPMDKTRFAEAARAQASEQGPQIEGTSDIQEVNVLGDWAFMWQRLSVTVTPPDGPAMVRAGHTLSIFHKQDGRWLLARDANLLAAVDAPGS